MNSTNIGLNYRLLVNDMLPNMERLVVKLNKLFIKFIHEVIHEENESRYIPVKDIVDLEMNPVLAKLQHTEHDYEATADNLITRGRFMPTTGESRMVQNLLQIFLILGKTFQKHMETLMSNIPFVNKDNRDFDRKYWKKAVSTMTGDDELRVERAYKAMRDCKETIETCLRKIGVVERELVLDPPIIPDNTARREDTNQAEGNDYN